MFIKKKLIPFKILCKSQFGFFITWSSTNGIARMCGDPEKSN